MTMPEISVIIPIYNSQAFLRECIDSVLAQSFTNWQLILVDDGSTDDSLALCRDYAVNDRRIKVITKTNGGLSSARNAGLDVAKGDYVFFLDSDDELFSHSLQALYTVALASDADITIGKPAFTESRPTVTPTQPTYKTISPRRLCIDTLYQRPGTDNSACWRLFRKSMFDGLRFYNGWYEDLEIFHKLLMKAHIVAVTDCIVYFYRKHPESFIHSWSEGRGDIVKVTGEIVSIYSGDPQLRDAALNRFFSANYNYLLALLHNHHDDNRAVGQSLNNIKALRRKVLFDSRSRLKDRIGAVISYFGPNLIKRLP